MVSIKSANDRAAFRSNIRTIKMKHYSNLILLLNVVLKQARI